MAVERALAAVAVLAVGALVLGACAGPATPEPSTAPPPATVDSSSDPCKADLGDVRTADGTVSVSVGEEDWLGYNGVTPQTATSATAAVDDRLFSGFVYFGTDGTVCPDTSFGTMEVVSEDPLEVRYTINDSSVWSDGQPVEYADYLLDWATQAIPTQDSAGTAQPEPLFHNVGFPTLGQHVPTGPDGEVGGKTFTYRYAVPFADWKVAVGSALPAHVVAAQIGVTTADLVTAIRHRDYPVLDKAAQFWNTAWSSPVPGVLPDAAITPVNGPYTLAENGWTAGQSLTLTANPAYGGPPPATKNLTFRFVAADAHVQALANGDLDVIEPQATVDTLAQLAALGDRVRVATGDTFAWEHLDFNFRPGAAFADSLALREAFALCVPRRQIVDTLIAPINPAAVVLDAREVLPFQPHYADVVGAAYDGRYDAVDLDAARARLAEAGVTTPVRVRVAYPAPNPRRTDEVALIASSCDQAGFDVVDAGSADFFDATVPTGAYDVALFAWAGAGQVAAGASSYVTNGPQNFGGFSDPRVDAAWATLAATVDEPGQVAQLKVIEKLLWEDLYGIPLFAHPGVVAYSSTLADVRRTSAKSTVAWNAEQWARAG